MNRPVTPSPVRREGERPRSGSWPSNRAASATLPHALVAEALVSHAWARRVKAIAPDDAREPGESAAARATIGVTMQRSPRAASADPAVYVSTELRLDAS